MLCVRTLIVLALCLVSTSYCGPVRRFASRSSQSRNTFGLTQAIEFLESKGYLRPSEDNHPEEGETWSEKLIKRAIRKFQRFNMLDVTGEFDDATKREMRKKAQMMTGSGSTTGQMVAEQQSKPWCGVPEPAPLGSQFRKTDITYRIRDPYSNQLQLQVVERLMAEAFKFWTDVIPLNITRIYDREADIEVSFGRYYHGDNSPFDGPSGVLAHAYFPTTDGVDLSGLASDIHFDDDEFWSLDGRPGTNNFLYTAVHEIGHAIGLSHIFLEGSIMYPAYAFRPGFKLHPYDIQVVQYLYGAKQTTPTSSPETTTTTTAAATTTTRHPTDSPTTRPRPTGKPDLCSAPLDAAAILRGEKFFFSGEYFFRAMPQSTGFSSTYPIKTEFFWYGFPDTVTHIDAVYERPGTYELVFFSGTRYWEFDGNYMVDGFPSEGKPLTDFGLPSHLTKIDAAFVWGQDRETYLMAGDTYWLLNEDLGRVEDGLPISSKWEGVPNHVDTAFQFVDGHTYFFKNGEYYKFDDYRGRVDRAYPRQANGRWYLC